MNKLKSLAIAALSSAFFIASALAQTGQLAPGQVWGNFGATQAPASPTNLMTFPVVSGNLACFNGTTGLLQDCGKVVVIANLFPGADIGAKINAAITSLGSSGGTVLVSGGPYSSIANTITIASGPIALELNGSTLSFNVGVSGILITGNAAQFSSVSKGKILGNDTVSSTNNGITIQSPFVKLSGVKVGGFGQDSVSILSGAVSTPINQNADTFTIENSLILKSVRDNLHTEGADSNVGTIIGTEIQNFGRYGIYENSSIGNKYININLDGAVGGSSTTAALFLAPSSVIIGAYCEAPGNTVTLTGPYIKYSNDGYGPCTVVNTGISALTNQVHRYDANGYPAWVGLNVTSPSTAATQQTWGWRWNDSTKQIQWMDWITSASIMDYNPSILALDIPNLLRVSQLTVLSAFKIGSTPQNFPASGLLVGTTDTQTLSGKTLASPVFSGTASGAGTVPNSVLVNSAATVNSQTCTLGSSCTVTAAPSGSAGGDLTGTYPNPTLAAVVTAGGPTGSATVAPIITYDAKGRLTAVSSATITPAVGSITGLGTNIPAWLATPSSANLASALTDETGSGAAVFGTSPTLAGVINFTGIISPNSAFTPACGTGCSTVTGNDQKFKIVGSGTSIGITFGHTWPAAPVCTFISDAATSILSQTGVNTTALTIGASVSLAGNTINVHCY